MVRRFVYAVFILPALIGCATARTRGHIVDTSFDDAKLVMEQRIELERQSAIIADLERIVQSGARNLAEAERRLGSLEQGNIELAEWLARVDEFVRRIIEVKRELESVQFPDSGTDAGEG